MPVILYVAAVVLIAYLMFVIINNQTAAPSRVRNWAKSIVVFAVVLYVVHAVLVSAAVL